MSKIQIGRSEYKDKVYACWLGKNIGGTLGAKWENVKHTHAFTYYEPMPEEAAPNDDLDLQLVWLEMLEDQGTDPSLYWFAQYWNRHARCYGANEYAFFMRNFDRGLMPPVAGCFENYFVDEMGSPIRSEIWACLYPGDPQAAACMAWKDSLVDHAGGEGTYGEMFWAAVEAAAFVETDTMTLIQIGLNMIPISSHIARVTREVLWCYQAGLTWGETREKVVTNFNHHQPANAIPNHGFTIIGWLYGKDFGDRLCKAVNCGYDSDCTAATLGALMGILEGTKGIPERWSAPIGDGIVTHLLTRGLHAPKNIEELTDRTVVLSEKTVAASDELVFGETSELPDDLMTMLFRNERANEIRRQDIHAGVMLLDKKEVWLHYSGEPVLRQGIGKIVYVTMEGCEDLQVDLIVPEGWTCTRLGSAKFQLYSSGPVADRNTIQVLIDSKTVEFGMLGPGEAKGFPAGTLVETCPKCEARVGACICDELAEEARSKTLEVTTHPRYVPETMKV